MWRWSSCHPRRCMTQATGQQSPACECWRAIRSHAGGRDNAATATRSYSSRRTPPTSTPLARTPGASDCLVFDPEGRRSQGQNLTQAQIGNAEKEAGRSRDALHRSIRGAWVHILHPGYSDVMDDVRSMTAGHVMRSTRLVNRGGGKSVPQAVWERVSTDGTVIGEIGPDNLLNSLRAHLARGSAAPAHRGHPRLVRLLCLPAAAARRRHARRRAAAPGRGHRLRLRLRHRVQRGDGHLPGPGRRQGSHVPERRRWVVGAARGNQT